jgi:hypothetical protein
LKENQKQLSSQCFFEEMKALKSTNTLSSEGSELCMYFYVPPQRKVRDECMSRALSIPPFLCSYVVVMDRFEAVIEEFKLWNKPLYENTFERWNSQVHIKKMFALPHTFI